MENKYREQIIIIFHPRENAKFHQLNHKENQQLPLIY